MKSCGFVFGTALVGLMTVFGAESMHSLDVRISTGGCHAVYSSDETPALTLAVSNGLDCAQEVDLQCRLVDYFGRVVATTGCVLSAAARCETKCAFPCPIPSRLGFYCAIVDWQSGDRCGKSEGSFVRVGTPPQTPDRLFGISSFAPNDAVRLYSLLGVGTKAVLFRWRGLEDPTRPGELKLEGVKAQVAALKRAGIRVIGHLEAGSDDAPRRYFRSVSSTKEDPVIDKKSYYADMDRYVRQVAAAFGNEISEWSATSEIDLQIPTGPYVRQRYLDLVRIISRGLRAESPSAKLMALGCSGGDGRAKPRYPCLRSLLPELSADIDGLAIDQYTDGQCYGEGYENLNSEQAELREIMQEAVRIAHANGKRMVAIDEKGPCIVRKTPISSALGTAMADGVARDFILLKTVPEVQHWLYFRPFNWSPSTVEDWGMWEGANPRQVVSAYAATARMMAQVEFVKGVAIHGDIPCWMFRRGDRYLATLWYNGREPLKFKLSATDALSVFDVQGNPIEFADECLFLTGSPVYLLARDREKLENVLCGAHYEVPDFSAVIWNPSDSTTALALRNLSEKTISVSIAECMCDQKRRDSAAEEPSVVISPRGMETRTFPFAGAHTEFVLYSGRGGRVRVAGVYSPYRVQRVASWDDLRSAPEIVVEDLMRQAPTYADLHANGLYGGIEDLSVRARFGYDDKFLYMEYCVRDDVHHNRQTPARAFVGDCVQFAVDTLGNGRVDRLAGKRGFGSDDYNFVSALADGRPTIFCYRAAEPNAARLAGQELPQPEIVRDDERGVTRYRIRIAFSDLSPLAPVKGRTFGMTFLSFDMDGRGGGYYFIEYTPGLAEPVNPSAFGTFVFD